MKAGLEGWLGQIEGIDQKVLRTKLQTMLELPIYKKQLCSLGLWSLGCSAIHASGLDA